VERENPNALNAAVSDFISKAKVEVTHDLTAPISMGEIVGNFSYFDTMTGNTVTAKLVAGRDVAERIERMTLTDFLPFLKIFSNRIFLVLLAVLALLIVLIALLIASRRAARQRRRRRIYEQRKAEYMRRQREQDPRGYDRRPAQLRGRSGSRNTRRPR